MNLSFSQVVRNLRDVLWMGCREASRAQSEMLDYSIPASRRLGLRLHLAVCGWCRRYGKQIKTLHQAARDHPENLAESAPHGLPIEARERIKQRLRERS
jgi:hypothetical protein